MAILRDVTEKRHVELLRDRFISAVTHELRTPLGPLQLHVDYALSGKLGPIPEKIRSSLQVVKRNTDHLVQLTDDLLDIRRIESGMFQLALEPTDFLEILEQTMTEIQVSLDMRRQSIHVEVPKGSLIVQGDRIRLKQVLINLLSNASKFTSEQGKIAIRIEDRTDTIQVQVSDTGIGITKQDLPRIFKPFATIQKPTYIKGTGLGLSITKGIIEAHGGNIAVKSDGVGHGSTFTFTLPKRKETS